MSKCDMKMCFAYPAWNHSISLETIQVLGNGWMLHIKRHSIMLSRKTGTAYISCEVNANHVRSNMFGHLHRVTLQHVGLWTSWAQIKQHQRGILSLRAPRFTLSHELLCVAPATHLCSPFSLKHTKYSVLKT